jgi:hypothetical protein
MGPGSIQWIWERKRSLAVLIVLMLIVGGIWYLWLPYPTPNRVELVHISVEITLNETNLDDRVPADFGPHCSNVHYHGGFLSIERNVYSLSTQVVVVIDYEMHHHDRSSFRWNLGDGQKEYLFEDNDVDFQLVSPVNASIGLVDVRVSNEMLTIGEAFFSQGEDWDDIFQYPIMDGRYTVTEVVNIENMGYKVAFTEKPWPCE